MAQEVGYRRLTVFQKGMEFVWLIYKITIEFPKYELFGLTSQLRRAVLSIPLNIAEGYVRDSRKDYARFLSIALGSAAEADVLLDVAYRLAYCTKADYEILKSLRDEIGKLLYVSRRNLLS